MCPACFKTATNVKTHETMCGQVKKHRERMRAEGCDEEEAEAEENEQEEEQVQQEEESEEEQ